MTPSNALTYAELSTILAALRTIQRRGIQAAEMDIATSAGEIEPLSDEDVDDLCERLNCGRIVTITGGPKQ